MELNIAEKLLLIAHHPAKGRFITSELHVKYGIIGAFLLQMSIEDKITIENDRLILKNTESTIDPIISELSIIIESSKKSRKIKYWINKFVRKAQKYKWSVLHELEKKRLLRIENKKFLGLIPYKRSYIIDNNFRTSLIKQLKSDIILNRETSNENVVILGLIEACKLYKIFTSDKHELKILEKKLKVIIKESPIADTLNETIKQVQAAIIVTLAASTVASTAGGSH